LGFRILDATAFYAGVPFGASNQSYTTSLVYDEIKHIKKNHSALETLLETNRLKIADPDSRHTDLAIKTAKKTGDFQQLSKEDISIIALGINLKGELITDDFAISNVAKNLGLKVSPIMTSGITRVGKWIYYCPACHKNFVHSKKCPICGSQLKKKLLNR